jgi:GT2 family glycosyltransferase
MSTSTAGHSHSDPPLHDVGVVAIGRNEGERLVRCLESLPRGLRAVYVDSGSTDGSREAARQRGVEVVELDLSVPFTAARARNAGFARLQERHPEVQLVQFLDGDCEVQPGWIETAAATLRAAPDLVAVCGWRRERYADRTVYNTLCDVEWRLGPVGETLAFGGDVMIRAAALAAVGAYDEQVIAAEDDEVGIRLRAAGGRFLRLDRVSTVHDAAMTRIGQWWNRAKRCGHAYAQVSDMHGGPPERYYVEEKRRTLTWGVAVPALATGLALPTLGLSLWLFAAYPAQAVRTYRGIRKRGFNPRESLIWAVSCTACKVPEAFGVAKYHLDKLKHRRPTIIEYKK